MSDFTKSAIGLFAGTTAGLLFACVVTMVVHYQIIQEDPNNHGAITASCFGIPICMYVGAVIGCVLSEKYWFENAKPTKPFCLQETIRINVIAKMAIVVIAVSVLLLVATAYVLNSQP